MVLFLVKFLIIYCKLPRDKIINILDESFRNDNALLDEEIISIYNKLSDLIKKNVVHKLLQVKYAVIKGLIPVCFDLQGLIETNFNTDYASEIASSYSSPNLSTILEEIKKKILGDTQASQNKSVRDIGEEFIFNEIGETDNQILDSLCKDLENLFSDSGDRNDCLLYSTVLQIVKNLEQGSIENIKIDQTGTNPIYQWTMALDKALFRIIEFSKSLVHKVGMNE